jgi:aspartate carbamoyltransferase catalytic subunit
VADAARTGVDPIGRLTGQSLCDLDDLAPEAILEVLDTAEAMAEILERPIPRVPALRGRSVLLLFYEPSTRTRHSFELACKALGADSFSLSAATSSVAKGESLVDTVRTCRALGADALVLRHPASGAAHLARSHAGVPVINAGDGTHAHPTQGLLDLFTVRRRKGRIAGLRLTVVGDILHSRVARSAAVAFRRLGAEVTLCGPPTLLPPAAGEALGARVCHDLDAALAGADVVMALRLQRERQEEGLLPSLDEYRARWGLDRARLARAAPDVVLLHPGPVHEGVEVHPELLRLPASAVAEQVRAGVAVRMAVLYQVLAGGGEAA